MADNISATILRGEQEIPANRKIFLPSPNIKDENDNDNEKSLHMADNISATILRGKQEIPVNRN